MVACLGFAGSAYATDGLDPIEALKLHLQNPALNNFATTKALPFDNPIPGYL